MRKLLPWTVIIVGLMAGTSTLAFGSPATHLLNPGPQASNVEHAEYYWNHHRYHHRSWDRRHHHWHYYD